MLISCFEVGAKDDLIRKKLCYRGKKKSVEFFMQSKCNMKNHVIVLISCKYGAGTCVFFLKT